MATIAAVPKPALLLLLPAVQLNSIDARFWCLGHHMIQILAGP